MATVREYFDTDPRAITIHADWGLAASSGSKIAEITAKIAWDFEGNAKYWYFFIPANTDASQCLELLLASPEVVECRLGPAGDGVHMHLGFLDYSERQSVDTLGFTRRVHLYVDADLSSEGRERLVAEALSRGYYLYVRDREYARKRSEVEKPLAFISHDSRDKDSIVRDLAHEMIRLRCPVWYDEYSLKVGDSLRVKIEKGLRQARKCIVVLSPHFLANDGWTKAEFDSVFTREILERSNVILPVWHNVGVQDVFDYSPRLADKVGLSSSLGAAELARRLVSVIKNEG